MLRIQRRCEGGCGQTGRRRARTPREFNLLTPDSPTEAVPVGPAAGSKVARPSLAPKRRSAASVRRGLAGFRAQAPLRCLQQLNQDLVLLDAVAEFRALLAVSAVKLPARLLETAVRALGG